MSLHQHRREASAAVCVRSSGRPVLGVGERLLYLGNWDCLHGLCSTVFMFQLYFRYPFISVWCGRLNWLPDMLFWLTDGRKLDVWADYVVNFLEINLDVLCQSVSGGIPTNITYEPLALSGTQPWNLAIWSNSLTLRSICARVSWWEVGRQLHGRQCCVQSLTTWCPECVVGSACGVTPVSTILLLMSYIRVIKKTDFSTSTD